MKKNKIVGALALMMLGTSPAFAAENSNTNFESTATIENTCLIEADDVNFGQVYAPLTTQGTKSEMRVLCSKNTPYTIDLAYGGKYGSGSGGNYTTSLHSGTDNMSFHAIYKDGVKISNNTSDIWCDKSSYGNIQFLTSEAAILFGYHPTLEVNKSIKDVNNICNGAYLNQESFNAFAANAGVKYDYGVMSGASKGDNLAYKITVPGDISQVWNTGNGSYKATATGEFDKIEVNAQIVPTNSSSLYIAQDSYIDTVTAVISY